LSLALLAPVVQSLPVQMIKTGAVVKDRKDRTPCALTMPRGGKVNLLNTAVKEFKYPANLYDEMKDMAVSTNPAIPELDIPFIWQEVVLID